MSLEVQNSDAVFTGVVADIRSAEPGHFQQVWVTLNVTAIWKGTPGAQVRILTGANSGICGVPFDLNREWLVFARNLPGEPGRLTAGTCSRTASAANNPDVRDLGPPDSTPSIQRSWGKVKALYR